MIHGNLKKLFAGLLAAVMVLTSMPLSAYATEDTAVESETEEGQGSESAETSEEAAQEERIGDAWMDNVQSSDGETSTEETGEERHTDENSTDVDQTYIPTDEAQDSLAESLTEDLEEEETRTEMEESETESETEGKTEIANTHADNGGYPYSVAAGVYVADKWGFYQCECTSFVAYCLNERNGFSFWNTMYGSTDTKKWGNANHWGDVAKQNGFSVDNNPAVGAVAWSGSGTYGHVAWVCAVNGDQVTIDEYNYASVQINGEWHGNHLYRTRKVNKSAFQYIHIKDITSIPDDHGGYWEEGYYPVIPNGDYHIVSSLGDQWWLTNAGFSKDNGGNVQLWEYSDMECDHHLYHFEFIPDGKGKGRGFYKITNKYSGKYLDSEGSHEYLYSSWTGKRANLQQWKNTDGSISSGQQWAINEIDGGDKGMLYTFQARCSGYYIDLEDAKTESGTNISMWKGNESLAQQWRLIPWAPSIGQTIKDGEYQIVYSTAQNKAIGFTGNKTFDGVNVELSSSYKGDYRQTFDVKYLGNGYYSIVNKYSGLSLDVAGGPNMRRLQANIQLWTSDNESDAQKWIIKSCGNGYYNVISKCNGLYLDLEGGDAKDANNISLWHWNSGGTNQMWKFIPYEKPKLNPPTPSIASGTQVEKGTKLTLSCPGADKIYYTTDGTQPTTQSTQYSTQGITINTDMTLKTFAVKEGYRDSDIVTYTYTVKQPEPSSEKESSSSTESSSSVESSSGEENPSDVESGADKESAATEESSATPEDTSAAEDIEDDIKWNYDEAKVTYKDLSESGARITANIRPKIYDGTPYRPVVKVTAAENGKTITLTEGADYRVAYAANIHAGRGKVTVYGNGIYKGKISAEFEIRKKPLKKLKVVTSGMIAGDTSKPKVYVYDGGTLLKEGKDYTLDGVSADFAASKGKKKIYIMAAPSSDYEGFTAAAVTVYDTKGGRIQGVISNPDAVKLSQTAYPYTGQACTPTAAVTVNGQPLTAGRDYTIKYQNNKEAGTAFAIITGKGAYAGSVVKEFTIKASDGEFILKNPIKPAVYNGSLQKPKLTVTSGGKTLKQNKDYTITYADNLHATDRAKAIVRGKGSYAGIPAKTFYFTITPCNIKKASVKTIQGKLTLTYAKHTLVEGVDYVPTYGSPDSKGRITVTIKAKDGSSFTGEVVQKIK